MIILSPAQDRVLAEVDAWLRDPSGAQWKYLAGYAGTGKSTLAKKLAEDRAVAFCAFTGKAANVLRSKGCAGATTLHRLIMRGQERAVKTTTGEQRYSTEFVARSDDPLAGFDLVVLDECSMISSALAQDLLSYGKRVLVLGDPFQLPPVSGEGYFVNKEPHWVLTEVHRQAAESGILRLATDIRTGRGILDPGSYLPDAAVVSLEEATERESELLDWTHIVLVGTHRMRHHFNRQYRDAAHRRGPMPEKGEQLVCLANDHKKGLLNGAIWNVEGMDAVQRAHHKLEMFIRSEDDPAQSLLVEVWDHDFLGTERELEALPHRSRMAAARFAYGYAVTVHKFQGSEADRVLVIDESSTFREASAQWLYTACTRAAEQLVLVRR